jgi:hypothetical protein
MAKPIHVKPNFYSSCIDGLKEISMTYGYNLVIHGSLTRDLDLLVVPWNKVTRPHIEMITEFADYLGGWIDDRFSKPTFHGRVYVINLNRKRFIAENGQSIDPQYYLDISVIESYNSRMIDNLQQK